jgi:NADH-quinone oxidoreductase subunit L
MPITFWTFLIGGFALSGFPLVTAGFWSKDEILADAWGHGHTILFATLAIAAFMTAFYTMRQITLTFLGEARTEEAAHAHETPWTMTGPLVVLSFFAVTFGWVGIPEHFTGGLIPNWFHEFVGSTLAEHPETLEFSAIPLLTSLVVALGGLGLGYAVYSRVNSVADDKLQIGFLKNKYYIDELYTMVFINPIYWFAENVIYKLMDMTIINGILHFFGPFTQNVGSTVRNYFDVPVINQLFGDGSYKVTWWTGENLRPIQTGRIQQYLLLSLVILFVVGGLLYYILTLA